MRRAPPPSLPARGLGARFLVCHGRRTRLSPSHRPRPRIHRRRRSDSPSWVSRRRRRRRRSASVCPSRGRRPAGPGCCTAPSVSVAVNSVLRPDAVLNTRVRSPNGHATSRVGSEERIGTREVVSGCVQWKWCKKRAGRGNPHAASRCLAKHGCRALSHFEMTSLLVPIGRRQSGSAKMLLQSTQNHVR